MFGSQYDAKVSDTKWRKRGGKDVVPILRERDPLHASQSLAGASICSDFVSGRGMVAPRQT